MLFIRSAPPLSHIVCCNDAHVVVREAIYRLCCEHNLILLEDDPYRYLEFADERTPR